VFCENNLLFLLFLAAGRFAAAIAGFINTAAVFTIIVVRFVFVHFSFLCYVVNV